MEVDRVLRQIAAAAALTAVGSVSWGLDDTCIAGVEPNCALFLQGSVLVHRVDERRILIAVDTDEKGAEGYGRLDHLFLYTGAQLPEDWAREAQRRPVRGALSLAPEAKYFELKLEQGARFRLSLDRVQWSHYWGYDAGVALEIEDLTQLRSAKRCDHVAGSCWEVNGFEIGFPG